MGSFLSSTFQRKTYEMLHLFINWKKILPLIQIEKHDLSLHFHACVWFQVKKEIQNEFLALKKENSSQYSYLIKVGFKNQNIEVLR